MLYTLLKFLGWGALLAVIGGCVGWALRALKCRSEVARAKASTIDTEEVERMRHRLANLEQVVAERDRLRIQLADVRHADSPGIVGGEVPDEPEPEPEPESEPESEPEPESAADAEADAPETDDQPNPDDPTSAIVADAAEPVEADDGASSADEATTVAGFADVGAAEPVADEPAATDGVELDLDAAAEALGGKIKLDDLTVIEGIGPKISELCGGIGIETWRQLASTDIADLQSMLEAAGSRYAVHKPGTWPQQAELLATGRWAEFKTLTDELDGGK